MEIFTGILDIINKDEEDEYVNLLNLLCSSKKENDRLKYIKLIIQKISDDINFITKEDFNNKKYSGIHHYVRNFGSGITSLLTRIEFEIIMLKKDNILLTENEKQSTKIGLIQISKLKVLKKILKEDLVDKFEEYYNKNISISNTKVVIDNIICKYQNGI